MIQHGDTHILEAFDGKSLVLPALGEYTMLNYGDFGMPPVNFVTRRGFQQAGETFLGYTIGRRSITLEIDRQACSDRAAYWRFRSELHDLLRHNRGGLMTYTLIQPDGIERSLRVTPEPGFVFAPSQADNWDIRESIRFIAFDPIWFDPVTVALTLSGIVSDDLVFPITFPIVFGLSGVLFSTSITYTGTWETFPTIVLTGPYDWVNLQNVETGVFMGLSVPIGAGETRTIVLTPGEQRITDQDGISRFDELAPDSDLIHFNIRPDPQVAGGSQQLLIQMQGGDAGLSGATLSYTNRYVAI